MTVIQKIAIVVPAHNEEAHIAQCLQAIYQSIENLTPIYPAIAVEVIVVLDNCEDNTQPILATFQARYPTIKALECQYRNVGKVRALGVEYAMAQGADWIACTDADSQVSKEWLLAQLQQFYASPDTCEMICGVVSVDSWAGFPKAVQQQYLESYQDKMGHRHIHGANLGFLATAYTAVGGFSELPCHEDVDLVKKFEANQSAIIWSNQVRVMTSSRLVARTSEGFAYYLSNLLKQS